MTTSIPTLIRRTAIVGLPVLILVGGGAAISIMAATAPKAEKKEDEFKPIAVQVAPTVERAMRISVTVRGQVRPRTQASLAAQVGGRVVWTSPAFTEGGAFAAGAVLARLETADYELAVVRARAQVAQAQEGLAREGAEAALARKDWEALGRGEASALTLREPQMAQAKAALASAEAALKDAELQLSRASIRAPFSGRVLSRTAHVGDTVSPGAPLAEIFATDVMEVRVPLTDADLAHLDRPIGYVATAAAPAPRAEIVGQMAGREHRWEGRLVRIDANVDPTTRVVYGLVEARGAFDADRTAPLAPGLFVSVTIEGPREETLIAAPRGALKRNSEVYVVSADDTIQIRAVTPAQTTTEEFFVRQGLAAGERVVVSPLPSAADGLKVTPVARTAAAPTQSAL